ncbi:MAG: 1-acyl-sn-glycerol-3-phosphate acyltransferase [Halioglobus sp.]
MSDPFAEIRPYRDEEVAGVLNRLLHDPELLDALARLRAGKLASVLPFVWRFLTRVYLRRQLRGVATVHDVQMVVKSYMDRMIEETTGGFTVSGLDALDPAKAYVFMSNHRDIAMDPAFTNYALHTGGHDTIRIAIGDNLLTKPWVSDVMRLNKSFIVKRSVNGPRELLAAAKTLSAYIQFSITQEGAPVWIAQREGRAKDGFDKTEPAVIKMMSMSRNKSEQSFGEHIASLNIVPVAISYELDPCDELKAGELHERAETGSYEKAEQEDVASIGRGIAGAKGSVHVSFGQPLDANFDNAVEVAAEVDRQILKDYCLHPTNIYAYRRLHECDPPDAEELYLEPGAVSEADFQQRIDAMATPLRPLALAIYANAVTQKIKTATGVEDATDPSC